MVKKFFEIEYIEAAMVTAQGDVDQCYAEQRELSEAMSASNDKTRLAELILHSLVNLRDALLKQRELQ